MPDDTEADVLRARLKAIVKEVENAVLEQTATAAHQRVPSSSSLSSSLATASQLVLTTSSTYKDTIITGLHLQTTAVLNVCQLVNIVLNSSSTNYAS
jgi:hypothetical protein